MSSSDLHNRNHFNLNHDGFRELIGRRNTNNKKKLSRPVDELKKRRDL